MGGATIIPRSLKTTRNEKKFQDRPKKFLFFKSYMTLNPLPSGTLAAFFLTAVGPIQHTKEGDISREKTILMTSLRLERAAAVR
jgi:hypothetical protein